MPLEGGLSDQEFLGFSSFYGFFGDIRHKSGGGE
jgi:hypothetical protein